MDGAQVTGASSSYARKYALNGLFCIDDTKDADTDEYEKQQAAKPTQKQAPKPAAQPAQPAPKPYPELDLEQALVAEAEASNAQSTAELTAIWNKYTTESSQFYHPAYKNQNDVFFKAVKARGAQLKAEGK